MRKVFLNSKEIAELLGFSTKSLMGGSLKDLIKSGAVPPPTKLSHKKNIWFVKNVERWLESKGLDVKLDEFINE